MPSKKKANIAKNTLKSKKIKEYRSIEAPYNRDNRLKANRLRSSEWRTCNNLDIREIRREADRLRKNESRAIESPINRKIRLNKQRIRMKTSRQALGADFKLAALNYNKECDYRYFLLVTQCVNIKTATYKFYLIINIVSIHLF